MDIINLIENECEGDFLDFKSKDYIDKGDFLVDIMAMANSMYAGDKYIIVGVKDRPNGEKEIIGIETQKDQAEFQQLVNENIEPKIKFEYRTTIYKDKIIGCYIISKDNTDRPYIAKKQYTKGRIVRKGECYVRDNSINSIATRRDYDLFYNERKDIKIEIKDYGIFVHTVKNPNPVGSCVYAPFKINIINRGNSKVIFSSGYVLIKNSYGEVLVENRIIGHEGRKLNLEFKLEVDGKDQFFGEVFLNFHSNDCIVVNMNEYGECENLFNIEIVLEDTEGNEYSASKEGIMLRAEGEILHKVIRIKGKNKTTFSRLLKHRIQ